MESEPSRRAFLSPIKLPLSEKGGIYTLPNAVLTGFGEWIWKPAYFIISPELVKPAIAVIMGLAGKQGCISRWMWLVIPRIISMFVILGVIGSEKSMQKQELLRLLLALDNGDLMVMDLG
jgi:hypothetical protein